MFHTGTRICAHTHLDRVCKNIEEIIMFISTTSGGGLDELPSDDMLAPSRPVVNPSISHSDVSESLSREVVLGGDR